MSHHLIIENVKRWPEHWQSVFQEMRIYMGMENAYMKICDMRRVNAYV